jgi:hypothetical protein
MTPKKKKKTKKAKTAAESATAAAAGMKVAVFDPAGGPLSATITSGQAQPGSYELLLWEANVNKVLMDERGNFLNSDDDTYELPLPNTQNHGRIVECIATAVITPPITNYALRLSIQQDGVEIGLDEAADKATVPTVTADLFVQLLEAP